MESELVKIIYEKYGINIVNNQILTGGWLNKKYSAIDEENRMYVIKLYSIKKVEKMSKGEFSSDYLDNQLAYSLKTENYMHGEGLNCERVFKTNDNSFLFEYNDYRVAIISFLTGKHVEREDITNDQLYNLGNECSKMHMLFRNVDQSIYSGQYLKIPTLDTMFERFNEKSILQCEKPNAQYVDLLKKQKTDLLQIKSHNIIKKIPISLIHGDFADDNILFEGNEPKILDFELVRINSPLLDIGRILMSYCFEDSELNFEKINAFVSGYREVNDINDKDIFLAFITVWINEVDMWIKEKYFDKEITEKAYRFQRELIYLTENLPVLIDDYSNGKKLNEIKSKKYSIRRSNI